MVIEDWSYATALYYSVVSLSTIGFGDYVAGALSHASRRSIAYFIIYFTVGKNRLF